QLKADFDVEVALIFIDTLIAAAGYGRSGDDNDAALAQRVMGVLSELAQHCNALTVGLDHFGKVIETGTRGSSAKEGHADAVLALLADRELSVAVTNTRLAVRKLRDGPAGLELPFAAKTIDIGTDPDGEPITRVVIDWGGQPVNTGTSWPKSL